MTLYYSWNNFKQDLEEISQNLSEVTKIGRQTEGHIAEVVKRLGYQGHVLNVGSTNPQRMTAVIDPRTPDDRYPCDFDFYVILDEEIDPEKEETLLSEIFPRGTTVKKYGRMERNTFKDKFPIGVAVTSAARAQELKPIIYTTQHTNFSEDEIESMRMLRLFTMRNGLYGGFTRGFKGMAIERMIKQMGDFDAVMRKVLEQDDKHDDYRSLVINSPVDQKDLAANVQEDIWRRLYLASERYAEGGTVKSTPYTIESWAVDHTNRAIVSLTSLLEDPHDTYKVTERLARKALPKGHKSTDLSILVIPHFADNQVLVSANVNNAVEFRKNLKRRWDDHKDSSLRRCTQ